MQLQKRVKEGVEKKRKLIEQIKKTKNKWTIIDSVGGEVDVVNCLVTTSYKNPELMAMVFYDSMNATNTPRHPLRRLPQNDLSPHDPNLVRTANIAIHKFNQEHDSSYVLEKVVSGTGSLTSGPDYTLAFVAAHRCKSFKVASLFYAHYIEGRQESLFKDLKLVKPFIELPEQEGNDGDADGDDDNVGDAAAQPNNGGKEAAEAQST